jgi:hypothetical protein
MALSLRRLGIATVAVAVANTTVRSMDEKLALVALRDPTPVVNRVLLGVEGTAHAIRVRATDGPFVVVGNNVNVFVS